MKLATVMFTLLAATAACTDSETTTTEIEGDFASKVSVPFEEDAVYLFAPPSTDGDDVIKRGSCECTGTTTITIYTDIGPFEITVCSKMRC